MSRRSRRAEAARLEAAAEKDFVHTAADRVGPLAQSAADRVGPLIEAAADAIGAAADKVSPLAHSAANRVGPLAQSAAERVGPLAQSAADRIAPLATSTVDLVGPYAKVAADRVSPYTLSAAGYAQSAAGRIAPLAASARLRGSQVGEEAIRRISPVLDDAVERISPVVESARDKVTGDLLPRLTDALGVVAAAPVVEEVVVPEKKKGRWVRRIAVVGALGAVIVVVARRFLGSSDADWQAARPTTPYTPPSSTPSPTPTDAATETTTAVADVERSGSSAPSPVENTGGGLVGDQPAEDQEQRSTEPVAVEEDFAAAEPAPVTVLNVTDSGDVEETVVDEVVFREPVPDLPEGEPVSQSVATDDPTSAPRTPQLSGEGVYVGSEPPEGFVIKGNDRSMKYHLPESAGYARTTAEVWFNSEEAAQQAGFVRAQR